MKLNSTCCILLAAVIGFAAANAQAAETRFTGAVSDDWSLSDNWETLGGTVWTVGGPPVAADRPLIGTGAYPDVSATIYAGTDAVGTTVEMTTGGNGTLLIESGASLTTTSSWYLGYSGGTSATASLTVNGTLTHGLTGSHFSVGGRAEAVLTLNEGCNVTLTDNMHIGQDYHEDDGYDTTVYHNGGILSVNYKVQMNAHYGSDVLYKMSGGTISVGYKWYTYGGTFEVAGHGTTTNTMRFYGGYVAGDTVLKFSGSDPLLEIGGNCVIGDPASQASTWLDLSELTVTPNTWVTVLTAGSASNADNLVLAPGTDPNWSFRLGDTAGNLEVFYTGALYQLGDMDGSDGAVEPNGNDINPFVLALVDRPAYELAFPGLDADLRGDCNQLADGLNGNDINPFVDFLLHGGPGYNHIPEPASALMLVAGLAGVVLRRKKA